MTRWLNYLFNIGTVTTIKICPCHINLPNYVQNVSQCKIRPSKNSQILLKFCQSGEISPYLVALTVTACKCTWFTTVTKPTLFRELTSQTNYIRGSGCGSVGRAVASNSRGQRVESSHWQKFMFNIFLSTVLKRRK